MSSQSQQSMAAQPEEASEIASTLASLMRNNNRIILVMERASSLEALLRRIGDGSGKAGQPPAARAAVEALPRVEIAEGGGEGEGECVICLEEFRVGDSAKEMPCRHRFHGECVERWLGIHGTCPICRHEMPVEEGESEGKSGGGGSSRREIWVRFSFRDDMSNDGEEEEEYELEDDDEDDELIQNGLTELSG